MLYSKETTIAMIDYRVNLMRQRGEEMNQGLINALLREKRALERKNENAANR